MNPAVKVNFLVSLVIVLLVWVHFVADFVLQTDYMALNKSKSNKWLAIHCAVYSIPFWGFGWRFVGLNAVAHYVTDWVSSRVSSHYWAKGDRHTFFVVIGADQAVHLTCLILSAYFLGCLQ